MNNREELISIVVPVYNVEKYLKRCLENLINQTYKNIEIIIVNDGSTDNSLKICEDYEKKDSRIKIISKNNEGLGMARNTGINASNGKYIAFIDSDDYVDLDFYDKLYNSAEENNSDMVFASYKKVDNNNKVYKIQKSKLDKMVYSDNEIISNILYNVIGNNGPKKELTFSSCMILYKREIMEKCNIRFLSEREYISEDLVFNLDFIVNAKIVSIVEDAYYYYCYNENSLTRSYNKHRFNKIIAMYKYLTNCMQQKGLLEETKRGINNYAICNVRACIKLENLNNKEDALKNIKEICDNFVVQQILSEEYPKTLKQSIFDFLIKTKRYRLLYFIEKIR